MIEFDPVKYNALRAKHIAEAALARIDEKSYEGAVEDAVDDVKYYLDSVGYAMPKPKYKFEADDITTWKYVNYSEKDGKKIYGRITKNPLFGYKR